MKILFFSIPCTTPAVGTAFSILNGFYSCDSGVRLYTSISWCFPWTSNLLNYVALSQKQWPLLFLATLPPYPPLITSFQQEPFIQHLLPLQSHHCQDYMGISLCHYCACSDRAYFMWSISCYPHYISMGSRRSCLRDAVCQQLYFIDGTFLLNVIWPFRLLMRWVFLSFHLHFLVLRPLSKLYKPILSFISKFN